ncbi:Hypothetical predicted protein [Lecanosticta acicola]|uniref:AA1-like domain-containing protein n=1 Tax=Lecanosticta acicola TaxID=111012 RepID=A0AAI8YTU4_9PEZI|nr:Hypothetical predicted protein [Lecanosticta acicola]
MHMISVITGLAGLAATAYAALLVERAALASDQPLQITNLTLYHPHAGNTTVEFNVYDPEPLTKNAPSATCTASWAADNYPKDTYILCNNTAFAWNFAEWNGYQDFTIGLEHQFTDPAVGKPPYDQLTVFGHGPYNKNVLFCEGAGSQMVCNQKKGTIVEAHIYATTA